ncbi:MAG: hypothetical protein ACK5XO_00445 [Phycisphaerales bacterium]
MYSAAVATLVVLGAIVMLLSFRSSDPKINSIQPDLVLTMTHTVPNGIQARLRAFGYWQQGMYVKAHPDGPDRYLIRPTSRNGLSPQMQAEARIFAIENEHRPAKVLPLDDPRRRILREDESEDFRSGKVLDIDIANRRVTLSDNDAWDRAPPPDVAGDAEVRRAGLNYLVARSGRGDGGEPLPPLRLVGGSSVWPLGVARARNIAVFGVFGDPPEGLGAAASTFVPASETGNGHLFVQFVDLTLGQRVGPVIEAQKVVPTDYAVALGAMVTPDGKFVFVVSDEETAFGSPDIVTRVSVIRVPD